MAPCGIDRAHVSEDALSYSLIFEGTGPTAVVDAGALTLLATAVLGGGTNGAARHKLVKEDIRWFAELEFRKLSLAKLLAAMGMRKAAAITADGSSVQPPTVQEDAAVPALVPAASEAETLRETMRRLAMGVAAPLLPEGCAYHVCIVHDRECADADRVCSRALGSAIETAFGGARVFVTGGEDSSEPAAAAAAAVCIVPFLTRGLLTSL
jgi:hypothetical protein